MNGEYINGYIERTKEGKYEGCVTVEGVNLSPVSAIMFKKDGKSYLWLRRKDMLEYDLEQQRYIPRKREPRWEAYLEKQLDKDTVAYKGEFTFMRFRFSIVGVWDGVVGFDKSRLNLFVERLPMSQQTIINKINERKNGG